MAQWEDPGGVPYVDEGGAKYWLGPGCQRLEDDPENRKYRWVEQYSDGHARPYYHNQETGESVWERPSDLAWVRVESPRDEL